MHVDTFTPSSDKNGFVIRSQHQAIQFLLADMAIGVETARYITLRCAWEIDQGRRNTYYASIAKGYAADVANKCATDAVQVRAAGALSPHYIPQIYDRISR